MAGKELDLASRTLHPLPRELRHGLWAIFLLASISFVFSFVLFVYLTFKLISRRLTFRRYLKEKSKRRHHHHDYFEESSQKRGASSSDPERGNDFALGIDGMFSRTPSSDTKENLGVGPPSSARKQQPPPPPPPVNSAPNQFLVLIYNLLLADLHQSLAFIFNGQWIHSNGIIVGTPVCFTQGFFVSTGDLSSSMFITLIAIHTYLSVVKGYRPPQRILYAAIVFVWAFVYLVTILPIIISQNGASVGGYMVRAVSWCWINERYETGRLLTQYLWIFIALVLTAAIYIAIWIHLIRRSRSATDNSAGYNPVFLLYPIIYISCTLPLALGRILTMVNVDLPMGYFCFAGAIISFNGFFDCILFSTTRHTIIFNSKYNLDDQDTGINTIAFLQTPASRIYGNMVWIQGGPGENNNSNSNSKQAENPTGAGEWWSWQRVAKLQDRKTKHRVGTSQENLRGIHMDMIATVVVEIEDDDKHRLGRQPSETAGSEEPVLGAERGRPVAS